ncbi:snaclec agglucetin subunit beta-1 [Protobothrops mucrosquamatus]|uniref:snaclec agglucetin subunit beta-1 n=1 Tax=Protobothrops mucrosquamatus TaxID=103944 RepID=UPI000775B876|nr:snaclec agglucetin subunit beta-1 [Protobothrops mucrosquamatus]
MFLITCFIFGVLGSLTWAGPKVRTVCPPGTFADKDGSQWYCYKFYEDRFTFTDAEEECQFQWRGHLASLTKDKQVKSIGAYVTKENLEGDLVWIGLQYMETGWRWTDGTRSTYKKWSCDEPKIEFKNDTCVGLSLASGHKKWVAKGCGRTYPFLCKWKPF